MKRTAILVDDDELVHKDVAMRLKSIPRLEFVFMAGSVDEAIEYFDNHPEGVDVIFCDIVMPGKDGYEANRLFAGLFRLFIFLTHKQNHGEEIYGAASMVHYLRKPVDAASVSHLLMQLDEADKAAEEIDGARGFLFLNDRLSENRVFVKITDILMIDFSQKYGEVTVAGKEKKLLIYGTVTGTMKQLKPWGLFSRLNGHCIISALAVRQIDSQWVVYFHFGGYQKVSRTYLSTFRTFAKRYGLV